MLLRRKTSILSVVVLIFLRHLPVLAGPIFTPPNSTNNANTGLCYAEFEAQLQGIYGQQYGGGRGTITCNNPVSRKNFQLFFFHETRSAVDRVPFTGRIEGISSQALISSAYLEFRLLSGPSVTINGVFNPIQFEPAYGITPHLQELTVNRSLTRTNAEFDSLTARLSTSISQTRWLLIIDDGQIQNSP
jgi:hypothetical protein